MNMCKRIIVLWGLMILSFIGCNENAGRKDAKPAVIQKGDLTYKYVVKDSDGKSGFFAMNEDTLFQCVRVFCEEENRPYRFMLGWNENDHDFVKYRRALCTGNMLKLLAENTDRVELSPEGTFLEADPFDHWPYVGEACMNKADYDAFTGQNDPATGSSIVNSISFTPITSSGERARLRSLATAADYIAWKNINSLLADQETLSEFLPDPAGVPSSIKDGFTGMTAEELLLDMAASVSYIIKEIGTNKQIDVTEYINQGIVDSNQWFAKGHGRIPAFRSIYTASRCAEDELFENTTSTCWKRCPAGMTWNPEPVEGANHCTINSGEATTFNFSAAQNACAEGYRLPTISEFFGVTGNNCTYDNEEINCNDGAADNLQHFFAEAALPEGLPGIWTATLSFLYNDKYLSVSSPAGSVAIAKSDPSSLFHAMCVRSRSESAVSLLPPAVTSLPRENSGLFRAVALLGDLKINVPCFASADDANCSENQLPAVLLSRVNDKRVEIGQAPYSSYDQLLEQRGIERGDITRALQYMLSHLHIFPRDTMLTDDLGNAPANPPADAPNLFFEGWNNPHVTKPANWYVAKNQQDRLGDMVQGEVPDLMDVRALDETGVAEIFGWMANDFPNVVATAMNAGNLSEKITRRLLDAQNTLNTWLGDRLVKYEFGNTSLTLTVDDPVIADGVIVDKFRAYSIGTSETIHQFDNYLCAHDKDFELDCTGLSIVESTPALPGNSRSTLGSILGAEDATKWHFTQGGTTVENSTEHTEGTKSISFYYSDSPDNTTYTLNSDEMPRFSSVNQTGSIDINPGPFVYPGIPGVQLAYKIPASNIWWKELMNTNIQTDTGDFQTLTFSLSSEDINNLTNNDGISFVIEYNNGEAGDVLIDNINIGVPSDVEEPVVDPNPVVEGAAQFELEIDPAVGSKYWVIERSTKVGDKTSLDWNPIGVFAMADDPAAVNSGVFISDGPIYDSLLQVVTPDVARISGGACEGPNGECLDPDWVPAIQNEVIGYGTQYETSYKYYLNLATEAAAEARAAREVLMNDILDQMGAGNVEEAQLVAYADQYLSAVKEICGDRVDESTFKMKAQELYGTCVKTGACDFKSALKGFMFAEVGYYGCDYNTDTRGTANRKKDAVHCSVKRECGDDLTLEELGILADVEAKMNLSQSSRNKISDFSIGDILTGDIFPDTCSGSLEDQKDCFSTYLNDVDRQLSNYSVMVASMIASHHLSDMPSLFVGAGIEKNDFGTDVSLAIEEYGFTYGAYFNGLGNIGVSLDEIKRSANSYLLVIENVRKMIQLIRSKTKLITDQTTLDIARNATMELAQGASFNDKIREVDTKICIQQQMRLLGDDEEFKSQNPDTVAPYSDDSLENALISLRTRLMRPESWVPSWSETGSAQQFEARCIENGRGTILDPFIADVCHAIAENFWKGGDWEVSGACEQESAHKALLTYRCGSLTNWSGEAWYTDQETADDMARKKLCYIGFSETWWAEDGKERVENIRVIQYDDAIQTICFVEQSDEREVTDVFESGTINDGEEKIKGLIALWGESRKFVFGDSRENDDVGWPVRDAKDLCFPNSGRQFGYYLGNDRAIERIIDIIRPIIVRRLYSSCDQGDFGCRVKDISSLTDSNAIDGAVECTSLPADDSGDKTDGDNASDDLPDQMLALAELQKAYEIDNLSVSIVNLSKEIESAKAALSTNLRSLTMKIANLSGLEEKQISLYNSFIDNVNSAVAYNVTSLKEWRTRFDFRRRDYQRKLARARYQAWVALKAIEFRFGIKLDAETESTPVMDAPKTWVKDLWNTSASQCGNGVSSNSPDGGSTPDAIQNCLTPEDLIERYVLNLEDFVNSYGNNPAASTQWWFHEDDDMGVVSMRDHLASLDIACNTSVDNMLYFSEEMEMDATRLTEVYGESALGFDPYIGTWNVAGTGSGVPVVTANNALLGTPGAIEDRVLNTSEAFIYDDMVEQYTADMVTYPANTSEVASISQQLDKTTSVIAYYGDATQTSDYLEFSVSHRGAPQNTADDCVAGELYYPSIARCAVPCSVSDTTPAPVGTCDVGQVCAPVAGPSGQIIGERICTWCTADLSCEYQNGEGMRIAVSDGDADVTGMRNVQTFPFWKRDSISTIERDLVGFDGLGDGLLNVSVQTMVTDNLVQCSENFSTSECGWNSGGSSMEYGAALSRVQAPDGTPSATQFESQVWLNDIQGPEIQVFDQIGSTLSFWARNTSDAERQLVVSLQGNSGGSAIQDAALISLPLSKNWLRYSVILPAILDGTAVDSVVAQFLADDEPGDYIQMWGVQFEEGIGATPYVAKGKNLLANTHNWNSGSWATNAPSDKFVYNTAERGPDSVFGVWEINDDVIDAEYVIESSVARAYQPGEDYVFSVWVKIPNDVSIVHPAAVYVDQNISGGDPIYEEINTTQQWQRIAVPVTISAAGVSSLSVGLTAAYTPDRTNADLPTGRLLIWGPQLERGGEATGYQRNGAVFTDSSRDWGFNSGLAAASLAPVEAEACYTDGQQPQAECEAQAALLRKSCCIGKETSDNGDVWTQSGKATWHEFYNECMSCEMSTCDSVAITCNPEAACIENPLATGDPSECYTHASKYVRNTYQREHYPDYCEVDNASGDQYPFAADLQSWPNSEIMSRQFKSLFKSPVPDQGIDYYSFTFPLNMDKIEAKDTFNQFGLIAPNNFNYRIRTVAMNVVGTDVLNCSYADSPSTCAANQWISYDLSQTGPLHVKNHRGESFYQYKVPMGYIRGGKAWAAEQVIGYPVSGVHQGALAQLQKVALMGRPLDGTFELRIYDNPELNWANVEDIQLILGYHYWTKSE